MAWMDAAEGTDSETAVDATRPNISDDDMTDDYVPGALSDQSSDGSSDNDSSDQDLPDHDVRVERRDPNSAGSTTPPEFAPTPLFGGNLYPPEYYLEKEATANAKKYHKKDYSRSFKRELQRTLGVWKSFCRHTHRPWRKTMKEIDLKVVESFLHFKLNQKTGENGKRARGTKITRSLRTFWDTFRRLFAQELRRDIDWKLDRNAVNNIIAQCNNNFQLSAKKKENKPMVLDDLKLQIEAILSTRERSFKLGEQRILTVLFLLMLAPVGARPEAVLQMRYGDIELAMHQPKDGGPPKLLIYTTYEFTKSYLGAKDDKTFIIPEVLYDPSMFLSPHVFLLAILFRKRAFRVDWLNDNPDKLGTLGPRNAEMQLPLPLRPELANEYVFCGVQRDSYHYFASSSRISYSTMNSTLVSIGRIVGFEINATAYHLRYAAGNNFNQCPSISKDMQNLMMDHAPNSDTFQRNYLARCVTFDVYAVLRELEPQAEVVREAASLGYRRIAHRPTSLSDEQAKALKQDPEYKYYEDRLRTLPKGTPAYHAAKKDLRAALERLRYAATKKAIGKEWTNDYAVEEIEKQLGLVVGTTATTTTAAVSGGRIIRRQPDERPMGPLQQRMVDALHAPMQTTLEKQQALRTAALLAIMAYCDVQEPIRTNLQQKQAVPIPQIMLALPPTLRADEEARLRTMVTTQYEGQRLKSCYFCVGEALTRRPSDPELPELCREYYTPASCARHFKRAHLKYMKKGHLPPCPICIPQVKFKSMLYLRSHAEDIHGIYQSEGNTD